MNIAKTVPNLKQVQDVFFEQVSDLDPVSYHALYTCINHNSCTSHKDKKYGKTPEVDAKNLHHKKKRYQYVKKTRKASKIYREYTQWK